MRKSGADLFPLAAVGIALLALVGPARAAECVLNCPAGDGGATNAAGSAHKSPDLNGNATVDVADFSLFAASWLSGDFCADYDCSGTVDLADFSLFAGHWLHSGAEAGVCARAFDKGWNHTAGDPLLGGEQDPPCADGDCRETTAHVLTHGGETLLRLALPELAIPGRGQAAFDALLSYRSQIDYDGPVGHGWNLSYVTDCLVEDADGVIRYDANRARYDRYDDASATSRGFFDEFAVDPGEIGFRDPAGLLHVYKDFDGSVIDGRLLRVEDRMGNTLTLDYNGAGQLTQAIESMGRSVEFEYGVAGHLVRIVDFFDGDGDPGTDEARVTRLAYNGCGQLESVTLPAVTGTPNDDDGIALNGASANDFPNGKTYEFRYDCANPDPLLKNNLLGVSYPNDVATGGPERLVFAYGTNPLDSLTYDRVTGQEVGGGQINIDPVTGLSTGIEAGGSYDFVYEDLAPRDPGVDLTTEVRKTTVTDPCGNLSEHFYNSDFLELRHVVYTNRDINNTDPDFFETAYAWSAECLLTLITLPEGNSVEYEYDGANASRFSQGNLLVERRVPDASRGGDQSELVTVWRYEPIYNQVRTLTTPRGNDTGFVPPIPDDPLAVRPVDFNLDGDDTDPADGETTRALRYTSLNLFDYQEGPPFVILALAIAEGVDLDYDGGGPITAVQVASALSLSTDQNGDGSTGQQVGNVIEYCSPNVILPDGTPQELVDTFTYNLFGQLTSAADPEGDLTVYYYFPEDDPDGDGLSEGLARPADGVTGGYLRMTIEDDDPAIAAAPVLDPNRPQDQPVANAGTARRTRTAAFVVNRNSFSYDPVGNRTGLLNGRGVSTAYAVNQLNGLQQITTADDVSGASLADPAEPMALVAFQYLERFFYDFNGNVIRNQEEDRGSTSDVGGDNPGTAFVDHVHRFDLLDREFERIDEVDDTLDLTTGYRYDANGNLTLHAFPEGNAESWLYDERQLMFRHTIGATEPTDCTDSPPTPPYDPFGGDESEESRSYDDNGNAEEYSDAEDTDSSLENNSDVLGGGDRYAIVYDGFDRKTSEIDPMGNQSVTQYDPDGNAVRTCSFGPVGGPSPTSDAAATTTTPISDLGVFVGIAQPLLSAIEFDYDERDRVFMTHAPLFLPNGVATDRPADLADGALDMGKGDLSPGPADEYMIPGLADSILGRVSNEMLLDRCGMQVRFVSDDLDTTRTDFDGLDRAVHTVDPMLSEIAQAWDDNGNLIESQETDVSLSLGVPAERFVTTNFYDALDRLEMTVSNIGQAMAFRYDSRGNPVAMADASGPLTGASIVRRAFPGGPLTENDINDFGNVTLASFDGLGRMTRGDRVLTMNGLGDGVHIGATIEGVKTTTPPPDTDQGGGDGLITRQNAWNGNSLLVTAVDDNGNRSDWNFDNLNRPLTLKLGTCAPPFLADRCDAPTTIDWTYDRDHNVVLTTDQMGSVIAGSFDAGNRSTALGVARAPGVIGTTAQSFEYDGLGRPTRETDDNDAALPDFFSEILRSFDSLGRVVEESQRIGSLAPKVQSVSLRAENLTAAFIFPNDRRLAFLADGLDRDRLIGEGIPFQTLADFDFMGRERILRRGFPESDARMTFLNGTGTAVIGYDGLRRKIQLRHIDGSNALMVGFITAFDRMNARASESKLHDPVNDQAYQRDSAYRLTDFARPDLDAIAPQWGDWKLDGVSNWKLVDSETRRHTSFNEIYERIDSGTTEIESDDNGNLTDDGTYLYEYDYLNRLARVRSKASGLVVSRQAWDASGRRVRKTVLNSAPFDGRTDYYHLLGSAGESGIRCITSPCSAEGPMFPGGWETVIEEHDASDVLTNQYGRSLNGGGMLNDLLVVLFVDQNQNGNGSAIDAGDRRLYYHANGSGSTFAVSSNDGTIMEGYQYDPYGRPVVYKPGPNQEVDFGGDDVVAVNGRSSIGNFYTWAGLRLDPETRNYLSGSRAFHPELGRHQQRGDTFANEAIGLSSYSTFDPGGGWAAGGSALQDARCQGALVIAFSTWVNNSCYGEFGLSLIAHDGGGIFGWLHREGVVWGVPGGNSADGDVDGADFLAWQRGFASRAHIGAGSSRSQVDAADFNVWHTNRARAAVEWIRPCPAR